MSCFMYAHRKKKITYTKARKIFISPTIRNRGRKDKESLKPEPW